MERHQEIIRHLHSENKIRKQETKESDRMLEKMQYNKIK